MTPVNIALPAEKDHGRVGTTMLGRMPHGRGKIFQQEWRQLYHEFHFVFELPYLSCHNLEPDELHVMHLGTTMYMLGAVLYLLCFNVLDGTPEDNMHAIWTDINQFYTDHRVVTQFPVWRSCHSMTMASSQSWKAKVQRSKTWWLHWHMCGIHTPENPM